ncbi:MAG: VTT domain-containing protein [Chlamydiia bacterium]|nr:VTT domain-containing protein [Chlamydiia bacterium]
MEPRFSRLHTWAIQKASSSRASLWIALLFSLELILFIPLDAILMFFCLQNRNKTFFYIAIASIASLCSGLIGYLVGHFLWDVLGPYIVPHLISSAQFATMSSHFQTYENGAVFFGALLPFPLKVLSLAAGVFHLGIVPFSLCLFAARLIRFFLVGGAMILWGERVNKFVERHFQRIVMVLGAKVAIVLLTLWVLTK